MQKKQRIFLYVCLVSSVCKTVQETQKHERYLFLHLANRMKLVAVLDGDFSKGLQMNFKVKTL